MPAEGWSVGAAALPLAILLVGLLGLHWRSTQAGIIALAVSAAVATIAFAASPAVLGIALWRAIALSLPVLYIILAALPLYQIAGKIRAIRRYGRAFGAILVLGVAMGGPQLLLALSQHWIIASFGAGMVGLVVSMGLARLARRRGPGYFGLLPAWPPPHGRREPPRPAPPAGAEMSFHLAFLPYFALFGVLAVATFIAPLNRLLDAVAVSFHFGTAQTGLGWTTESGAFHIPVFGHPGALLLYTSVLAVLLYRVAGRTVPDWRRLWRQVAVQGVPTTMTIITLVRVATVMAYSGMTFVLARGLTAAVGPLFPLLSPFLGLLGTVITGSNTNSNVLFGALQRDAARLLQMNPMLMAALQTAGGALGSMVAPAKVVLATATTGLAGRGGALGCQPARLALFLTVLMGIIGMVVQR